MVDRRSIKQKMIAYHAQQNSHYRKSIDEYRDLNLHELSMSLHEFRKFYVEAPGEDAPPSEQTVLGTLRDRMNFHAAAMDFLVDAV
jgi:hypothetical protein